MPASGAAEPDHQAALALCQIERQQIVQQTVQTLYQSLGGLPSQHILLDCLFQAGMLPEFRDIERIGQTAHIKEQVGFSRNAVLISKGHAGDDHLAAVVPEELFHPLPELCYGDKARINAGNPPADGAAPGASARCGWPLPDRRSPPPGADAAGGSPCTDAGSHCPPPPASGCGRYVPRR